MRELELKLGDLIGDIVDDLFETVEVGDRAGRVGFFEIATSDADPYAGLLIVTHSTLRRVEGDDLESFGGVCEVLLDLVSVRQGKLEISILSFEANSLGCEELDDLIAGFDFGFANELNNILFLGMRLVWWR